MYDIIIIGSGPAGLTAAIYASRAQLTAVVLEKDYLGSGQIAVSEQVDNYPGLPGIDGYTLGEKFREHAEQLGAKFENVEVDHIKQTAEGFTVFCKEENHCKAVRFSVLPEHLTADWMCRAEHCKAFLTVQRVTEHSIKIKPLQ